jgi:hypothetical protein
MVGAVTVAALSTPVRLRTFAYESGENAGGGEALPAGFLNLRFGVVIA